MPRRETKSEKASRKQPRAKKPEPGEKVTLTQLPPGLIDGLPLEDQRAISEVLGKPLLLNEYDEDGRAELEWFDYREDTGHTIWVDPKFIKLW